MAKTIIDSLRAIKKIQEADTNIQVSGTREVSTNVKNNTTANNNNSTEEQENKNETEGQEKKPKEPEVQKSNIYVIWPLNPFLPGVSETEKLIGEMKGLGNSLNIITTCINKGGDGHFDMGSLSAFKYHSLGASISNINTSNEKTVTSWDSLAKDLVDNNINNNKKPPQRENYIGRNKKLDFILNEANDANFQTEGKGDATTNAGTSSRGSGLDGIVDTSKITIYCTPSVKAQIDGSNFHKILQDAGITLKEGTNIKTFSTDNTEIGKAGTEIFQMLLNYSNGTKGGSAGKRNTKDTIASQKVNESVLHEADTMTALSTQIASNPAVANGTVANRGTTSPANRGSSEVANNSNGNNNGNNDNNKNNSSSSSNGGGNSGSGDWSWESIKANQGAKDFISSLNGAVGAVKKGLDDGGNPSMFTRIAKNEMAEIAKPLAAAATDAADFMLEGLGLGFIMPLVKSGIEEFKKEKDNKKYEGLEALIRDSNFQKLTHYFGDPKQFIERKDK